MKNKAIELFDFDGSYLGKLATRCETSTAVIAKAINSGQLRQADGAYNVGKLCYRSDDLDKVRDTQPRRVLDGLKAAGVQLSAVTDRLRSAPGGKLLLAVDRLTLSAATVDRAQRTIRGATVAVAGVSAIGKFVFRRRDGTLTAEPDGAVEKIQVATDDRFLETLLSAVQDAGGRLRVRIDHDDSIGARVGYAEGFRRDGDAVRCDVSILESAERGALILEAARKDPKNLGMSVDILPSFELVGGKAMMRVDRINAVDIVDRGAITPGGL